MCVFICNPGRGRLFNELSSLPVKGSAGAILAKTVKKCSNFKKSCTPEFLGQRDGPPLKSKLIKIRKTSRGRFWIFVLDFLQQGPEVSRDNEISESIFFNSKRVVPQSFFARIKLKLIKIRKTSWGGFLNFVLDFLQHSPEVSKNNEISESKTFLSITYKKKF